MATLHQVGHDVFAVFGGGRGQLRQRVVHGRLLTGIENALEFLKRALRDRRVQLENLADLDLFVQLLEVVLPHDHVVARVGIEFSLQPPFGKTELDPPVFDRRDHPAIGVDLGHHLGDLLLHPVGMLFQKITAAQGVDCAGDPGFISDHLLCPHGQFGREFRRDLERLIERAGKDRLRPAEHGGHGFDSDSRNIVVRLRRHQRGAATHHAETEVLGLGVLHAVTLLHQTRPHSPTGAELRDLLEEVHMDIKEE